MKPGLSGPFSSLQHSTHHKSWLFHGEAEISQTSNGFTSEFGLNTGDFQRISIGPGSPVSLACRSSMTLCWSICMLKRNDRKLFADRRTRIITWV